MKTKTKTNSTHARITLSREDLASISNCLMMHIERLQSAKKSNEKLVRQLEDLDMDICMAIGDIDMKAEKNPIQRNQIELMQIPK